MITITDFQIGVDNVILPSLENSDELHYEVTTTFADTEESIVDGLKFAIKDGNDFSEDFLFIENNYETINPGLFGDVIKDLIVGDPDSGNVMISTFSQTVISAKVTNEGSRTSIAGTFAGDTIEAPEYTGEDTSSLTGAYTIAGLYGDDLIKGASKNDRLYGGFNNDNDTSALAYDHDGNDLLQGFGGNDILNGGSGNDTVDGGAGLDHLYGGDGSDFFALYSTDGQLDRIMDFDASEDTISIDDAAFYEAFGVEDLGYSHDADVSILTLYLENSSDTSISQVDVAQVHNVSISQIDSVLEKVELTSQPEEEVTEEETVVINSLEGDDSANLLEGTDGMDIIEGNGGNDTINGAGGADTIDGGKGKDSIDGGAGADSIQGGNWNDTIDGGAGNDYLEGNAGNDYINGGDDDDTVIGGKGSDTMYGGAGYDILDFADGDQGIRFRMNLFGGYGYDAWGNEDDFNHSDHGFELIKGTSDDDIMIAMSSPGNGSYPFYDLDLMGEAGNDYLSGSGLAQSLDGGAGADTLVGAGGDDILTGGTGADIFVYDGAYGGNKLEYSGTDVITDFSAADGDIIQLSANVYGITDLTSDVTFDAATGELFAGTRTDAIAILEGVSSFDATTSVELI